MFCQKKEMMQLKKEELMIAVRCGRILGDENLSSDLDMRLEPMLLV